MDLLIQLFKDGVFLTFDKHYPNAPHWQSLLVESLCVIFSIIIPYLIGSINFAIVLSKLRGEVGSTLRYGSNF